MATMTVEQGIIGRLAGDASITAIVGSGSSARIKQWFPTQKNKRPFISITRVSSEYAYHFGGATSDLNARIQIDIWADTWAAVTALANLVRARLVNFRGTVTVGSDTVVFNHCWLTGDNTDALPVRPGSEERVKRISHDYNVWVEV